MKSFLNKVFRNFTMYELHDPLASLYSLLTTMFYRSLLKHLCLLICDAFSLTLIKIICMTVFYNYPLKPDKHLSVNTSGNSNLQISRITQCLLV